MKHRFVIKRMINNFVGKTIVWYHSHTGNKGTWIVEDIQYAKSYATYSEAEEELKDLLQDGYFYQIEKIFTKN